MRRIPAKVLSSVYREAQDFSKRGSYDSPNNTLQFEESEEISILLWISDSVGPCPPMSSFIPYSEEIVVSKVGKASASLGILMMSLRLPAHPSMGTRRHHRRLTTLRIIHLLVPRAPSGPNPSSANIASVPPHKNELEYGFPRVSIGYPSTAPPPLAAMMRSAPSRAAFASPSRL